MSCRIGIVPYLNALPLYSFLELSVLPDIPSVLEKKLLAGELDVALLPTFSIISNPSITPYLEAGCIASDGDVESVALFVKKNISFPQSIKSIYLTPDSRTSVHLFKVLFSRFWNDSFDRLKITTDSTLADARLEIGDKALFFNDDSYQKIDLGLAWQQMTGLPFVYAVWSFIKKPDQDVLQALSRAFKTGLGSIDSIVNQVKDFPVDVIRRYLTKSIQYEMDDRKMLGLKRFEEECKTIGLI